MKPELGAYNGSDDSKRKALERLSRGEGKIGLTEMQQLCIPADIVYIRDDIADELDDTPKGRNDTERKQFKRSVLEAISPGADLSGVADKFLFWALTNPEHGLLRHTSESHYHNSFLHAVAEILEARINGTPKSDDEEALVFTNAIRFIRDLKSISSNMRYIGVLLLEVQKHDYQQLLYTVLNAKLLNPQDAMTHFVELLIAAPSSSAFTEARLPRAEPAWR